MGTVKLLRTDLRSSRLMKPLRCRSKAMNIRLTFAKLSRICITYTFYITILYHQEFNSDWIGVMWYNNSVAPYIYSSGSLYTLNKQVNVTWHNFSWVHNHNKSDSLCDSHTNMRAFIQHSPWPYKVLNLYNLPCTSSFHNFLRRSSSV